MKDEEIDPEVTIGTSDDIDEVKVKASHLITAEIYRIDGIYNILNEVGKGEEFLRNIKSQILEKYDKQ